MVVGTPVTPASKIRRTLSCTPRGPKVREENILVTVRVRPLNPREQAAYDLVAWDITDEHTIVSRNLNHERPTGPYTFDRVFDPTCSTYKVYKEGARDVALSALNGINATIFAYGQTSSGKTFTMRGITENAVKDIYEHIKSTPERDFVLRLSALEIYNETVVDLLNRESEPLRLLDDPEKGTIVEKLIEEVVNDGQHLRHLIGICEAQRQVGETALNDKSSRSHQIIRLTIKSSMRENLDCVQSFLASLNLVDLAGSERASQTNADGTRLKEGSHINRSLLTLSTVIRKLSGGKRNIHIPYRDSKLTRILQPSLGGNARTAIICTMSPALSHVEQSRNTLSFATSAKEVTNNAQVNMVVADKKLVKHLQKEVARLEAELRSPEPSSSSCLRTQLMEKDMKIQQMEREVKELKHQLELERSANKEPKGLNQGGHSRQVSKCLFSSVENESTSLVETRKRKALGRLAAVRQSATSTDASMLVHEIRKLEMLQRQLGDEANRALEVLQKEFASHNLGSQDAAETIAKLLSEIKDMRAVNSIPEEIEFRDKASLKEEITRLNTQGSNIASLEEKLENVQKSIDKLVMYLPCSGEHSDSNNQLKKKKNLPFTLSNTTNMPNLIRSPCSPLSASRKLVVFEIENRSPEYNDLVSGTLRGNKTISLKRDENSTCISSKDGTPAPRQSNTVNVKKMQKMFKTAAEENIRNIKAYVTELKERVAKLQYQKQLLVCQVLELEANDTTNDEPDIVDQSPMSWPLMFEDQRKQIIMLWHLCHVSIVHRTQFYLLFRGDPADQIYMEVEIRRLTWLEQQLAELGNASPALLGDEPAGSVSSSIRALKQEREYLAKRVSSKLTAEEREMLYMKWDIPPEGKQRRRLQLVNKLWTDPLNMQHVHESAEIVAKLVGFCESGEHVSKEMFELTFVSPCDKKTWMGWNLISNLLHL
ncbi:kinesin-like protein NACK2 [Actinidia eriantha]|uniref:kinesin-like protein NACK2 n=1 Tax=Actinidia eriantha TaxID=165200 RepID=UPI002588DF09|nr:kinesin-like protein NACK2 [Actinidia eriantha]XP_057506274.1 kinesin-like protein NACK2 [Actinidia eriantha]XP_057506275.1 kinesin-like protein NACK2 [Actinidia eriantha]